MAAVMVPRVLIACLGTRWLAEYAANLDGGRAPAPVR